MSTTTSPPRSEIRTAADAVAEIRAGATLMVGGFGLLGAPLVLIEALGAHPGARDLTIISNNLGEPGRGLGRLLLDGRVRKAVGSPRPISTGSTCRVRAGVIRPVTDAGTGKQPRGPLCRYPDSWTADLRRPGLHRVLSGDRQRRDA